LHGALTSDGDLLPPWLKYPEIKSHSLGWRMGQGEVYMIAWYKWAEPMTLEQLVVYFKKYLPIPLEWLDWVAMSCGHDEIVTDMFSGTGEYVGINWLELQGLANFAEFKTWYDINWKASKDEV
jgi:hypothetical protein